MAEHVWTVLCNKQLVDTELNTISLFEVVEKLAVQSGELTVAQDLARAFSDGKRGLSFPVRMRLISYWVRTEEGEGESGNARISLLAPSGDTLWTEAAPIKLEKFMAQRIAIHLDQLPMSMLGRYWFVVQHELRPEEWKTVARIPLVIEESGSSASL